METCFILLRKDALRLMSEQQTVNVRQTLVGVVIKESYTHSGWCLLVDVEGVSIEVGNTGSKRMSCGERVVLEVDIDRIEVINGSR
jgi:hypothetical protein